MFEFLSKKFSGILNKFKDRGHLSEANIQEALLQVKEALLDADVPFELVETFLEEVKQAAAGQKITTKISAGQHLIKIVHERLKSFLGGTSYTPNYQIPSTIMVMGLQGSGKTTSVAKLALWIKKEAQKRGKTRRILVASVDFYRPAAIDQLKVLAHQIGIDFYQAKHSNALEAAKEIAAYAQSHSYEHLILDTAGRLQTDDALIDELIAIDKKLNPKHKLLVLDAITGQESLSVAKTFNEKIGFEAAILSKTDSGARGGCAFAFRYYLKKPIAFIGSGEKPENLETFVPERIAGLILGMGDILTLIEKADQALDPKQQDLISKRMAAGTFTLDDFMEQMGMVEKMGSLSTIVKYLPGMPNLTPDMIEKGKKEMKVFRAILSSMTQKERLFPQILNESRRQRIAQGSGTTVQEINKLLAGFEQSKQFAKMFKKFGKFKGF